MIRDDSNSLLFLYLMYFTQFFVKFYYLISLCTCGSVKIWVFFDHNLQYFIINQTYELIETSLGVKWEIKKMNLQQNQTFISTLAQNPSKL